MRDDSAITMDIKEALADDGRVSALDVNISTHLGVAILRGMVDTIGQREAAEEIAGKVQGVNEVRNELDVRSIFQGAGSDEMAEYDEEIENEILVNP